MEVSGGDGETNKKQEIIITTIVIASFLSGLVFFNALETLNLIHVNSQFGMSFTVGSIHSTITITDGKGNVVLSEYHAGALTQMGMNFTLANIVKNSTGAPSYNATYYTNALNLTFVAIGNQTATWVCNNTETVLPSEWNRTAGNQHDFTYNTFNVTAIFKGAAATQVADCISLNFEDGIGNNAQWGYDTFTEVTGIDSTFTITAEIKVTVS